METWDLGLRLEYWGNLILRNMIFKGDAKETWEEHVEKQGETEKIWNRISQKHNFGRKMVNY